MTLWLSYAEGPKSEPQALGTEFGRRLNYLLVTEYQPSNYLLPSPIPSTCTSYLYPISPLPLPYLYPTSTLSPPPTSTSYLYLLPAR
jgi:hypothetical protein